MLGWQLQLRANTTKCLEVRGTRNTGLSLLTLLSQTCIAVGADCICLCVIWIPSLALHCNHWSMVDEACNSTDITNGEWLTDTHTPTHRQKHSLCARKQNSVYKPKGYTPKGVCTCCVWVCISSGLWECPVTSTNYSFTSASAESNPSSVDSLNTYLHYQETPVMCSLWLIVCLPKCSTSLFVLLCVWVFVSRSMWKEGNAYWMQVLYIYTLKG